MRRRTALWPVAELRRRFLTIEFPEYQREPSIWSKKAKQRLVDSMFRRFDIASLYLSQNADDSFDCIDGRQRINAIMAFLGETDDADRGFAFEVLNEIYTDNAHPYQELSGMTFAQIEREAAESEVAARARDELLDYELTVVLLSDVERAEEFNLQFTRLNLGTIINAGEKLHAMVGAMRDLCFADDGVVGKHPFLKMVGVPQRRFARGQLGATILAQVFSMELDDRFTRARYFDLQKFLKDYSELGEREEAWIQDVVATMDWLRISLPEADSLLRSRAMVVSVVLLAWRLRLHEERQNPAQFGEFIEEFICQLSWQVQKGLDTDPEYRHLIGFQKHVTQASVERPAIDERHRTLEEQFQRWKAHGDLTGDAEYRRRTRLDPSEQCRQES